MKKLLFNILLLLFAHQGFGQINVADTSLDKKNYDQGIYAELLGGSFFYSIGYEQKIINRKHYDLLASIGLSTNFEFRKPEFEFGFPIAINNRFKFWRFNGVDVGLTLANFLNVWAIKNPEKYNNPGGRSFYPVIWRPSFHVGWMFKLNYFSLSPRFYGFYGWSDSYGFGIIPFFGLRFNYFFK